MILTSQESPRTRDFSNLQSLLSARKLDGTLALLRPSPSDRVAETGLTTLDASLGGGLPYGHLSEIVGPRSSGRMSVLCAVLAAATRRGEVVALVDTFDSFDPISGAAAGRTDPRQVTLFCSLGLAGTEVALADRPASTRRPPRPSCRWSPRSPRPSAKIP